MWKGESATATDSGSDCLEAQSYLGDLAKHREHANDLEHHYARPGGDELH